MSSEIKFPWINRDYKEYRSMIELVNKLRKELKNESKSIATKSPSFYHTLDENL